MKTIRKIISLKKKLSRKKYNSILKNKKRTRMININSLKGSGNNVVELELHTQKYRPPGLRKSSIGSIKKSLKVSKKKFLQKKSTT